MAVLQYICAAVCNGVVMMWTWPTRGGDVATVYRILCLACRTGGYVYLWNTRKNSSVGNKLPEC